jgi:hypothetical protein
VAKRLDAIIVGTLPGVRKAVKWSHRFTRYVKVAFFRGTSLRPVPPGARKSEETRYIDMHAKATSSTSH